MKKIHVVRLFGEICVVILTSACAILHSTQLSDIDSRVVNSEHRFEILVSETGINLQEAADIGKLFTSDKKTKSDMQAINDIISAFQMGPRTGNMVFNDKYADVVVPALMNKCPSGRITGLMSIRETAKYPVVSGEIVKLIGYCAN